MRPKCTGNAVVARDAFPTTEVDRGPVRPIRRAARPYPPVVEALMVDEPVERILDERSVESTQPDQSFGGDPQVAGEHTGSTAGIRQCLVMVVTLEILDGT